MRDFFRSLTTREMTLWTVAYLIGIFVGALFSFSWMLVITGLLLGLFVMNRYALPEKK